MVAQELPVPTYLPVVEVVEVVLRELQPTVMPVQHQQIPQVVLEVQHLQVVLRVDKEEQERVVQVQMEVQVLQVVVQVVVLVLQVRVTTEPVVLVEMVK
jgi:hypothetical protein